MSKKSLPFNDLDLNEHAIALKVFPWDELALDLINLEAEYHQIQAFLKPYERKLYRQLISLYEAEKTLRIKTKFTNAKYTGLMGNAQMSWLDDLDI